MEGKIEADLWRNQKPPSVEISMRLQTARPGGHMELPMVPRPESRYPQIRAVAFNSPPAALRQTIHPFCAG